MKTSFRLTICLTALVTVGLLGCGESAKPSARPGTQVVSEADRETNPDVASAEAEKAPAQDDVTLAIKDFDGIQDLIASKRGKVVVMDCWSTWCDPCVKEFPGLVELHRKYGPDDVACISLSFNYEGGKKETPEEHVEGVLEFLRGQGATFDNVIASVPSEELYEKLGFKSAAVPAIFVYDREGNIAQQFESGEAKYSEVGKLVAELIEKPPAASGDGAEQ
jgi:thiol-disulfide isomerase/thioredoxin